MLAQRQAPPMPTVTLPVPWQSGQVPDAVLPLPPQLGQTPSPVPGAPGGAWSPGAIGAPRPDGCLPSPGLAGWSERPDDMASALDMSIDAPGSSSPATDRDRSTSPVRSSGVGEVEVFMLLR